MSKRRNKHSDERPKEFSDQLQTFVTKEHSDICSKDQTPELSVTVFYPSTIQTKRKRKLLSFPRLVRYDIRRHYGTMFVNTINSFDIGLLFTFFSTYCHGNVCLLKQAASASTESIENTVTIGSKKSTDTILFGVESITEYFCKYIIEMPDVVVNISSPQIRTRVDITGSKLIYGIHIRGTKIIPNELETTFSDINFKANQIVYINNRQQSLAGISATTTNESLDEQKAQNIKSIAVCSQQSIQIDGTMVLHLDEERRICKIEIIRKGIHQLRQSDFDSLWQTNLV